VDVSCGRREKRVYENGCKLIFLFVVGGGLGRCGEAGYYAAISI